MGAKGHKGVKSEGVKHGAKGSKHPHPRPRPESDDNGPDDVLRDPQVPVPA